IEWKDDKHVSIRLSQLNTLITEIDGRKIQDADYKDAAGYQGKENQLKLEYTEQERKLTISEVINYLKTADTENAIGVIK
ncbi:MAG: ATPase, partial [Desulfobacteraceae bacterium]|nr:ATPase [Desulfobacteraceae bacterium]